VTAYTVPTAPYGWYLSDHPSEGALVVPLGNTEQDVADALARGWRPLLVTKTNTSTGRATARTSELQARPVVYSSRGGWRQGGRWVWFATPRSAPVAGSSAPDAPSYAAVLLDEQPTVTQTPEQARAARAAADAADQAATDAAEREQDEAEEQAWAEHLGQLRRQAPAARPAWLYTAPDSERGYEDPDDAPDTTPRPALAFYADAAWQAVATRDEHTSWCPRCAAGWCPWGTGLARRAQDAQQAAHGALAAR
jgi:hypothetical protein